MLQRGKTKTRDIIAIFVLAKVFSLIAAFAAFGLDGATNKIDLLSHTLSLVFFFSLLLFVTKRSAWALLKNTKVRTPNLGNAIVWIIVCIPLGFIVRLGTEGVYLVIANTYNHQFAIGEFNDLVTKYSDANKFLGWLAIIIVLVGALDEEFIYRKIFLWHFSKSYGLLASVSVTSLVFGAIHWNPIALMAAFCLACIYLASGRLWVAVIVHAAGNLFHPLVHPLVSALGWNLYFFASILSSVVLSLIILYLILRIIKKGSEKMPQKRCHGQFLEKGVTTEVSPRTKES